MGNPVKAGITAVVEDSPVTASKPAKLLTGDTRHGLLFRREIWEIVKDVIVTFHLGIIMALLNIGMIMLKKSLNYVESVKKPFKSLWKINET